MSGLAESEAPGCSPLEYCLQPSEELGRVLQDQGSRGGCISSVMGVSIESRDIV